MAANDTVEIVRDFESAGDEIEMRSVTIKCRRNGVLLVHEVCKTIEEVKFVRAKIADLGFETMQLDNDLSGLVRYLS